MAVVPKTKDTRQKKRINRKYTIDCAAAGGKIVDVAAFEKYLHDMIKVDGKAGNLGTSVTVSRDKNKVFVVSTVAFQKRYLKYLTKKFLKKKMVRDFLRVIATSKNAYELRFFGAADPTEL
ncbi:S60 ribosomal protein L22 [Tieghemostelium lacteum]|uniref:S60 ribosomal protein L22 n=1 Tax=Tieghemostelium lacteum TaxID=361077 RepID=A0A152A0P9_TIELA|nr:S60 ribosomal protein L22 [Tieghemostelium lacteum]|eukprot:KYQ99817.1 S60 ribosomal protein L22 [Tieghemostelium lacteum]